MDVQTVIPVPEASDYQVRIREKKQEERESRKSARGGGYDFSIAGERYRARSNRQFMFLLVSGILDNGGAPRQIREAVPWRPDMLVRSESPPGDDEQALHFDDETYILHKRWGPRTLEAAESLAVAPVFLRRGRALSLRGQDLCPQQPVESPAGARRPGEGLPPTEHPDRAGPVGALGEPLLNPLPV